MLMGNRPGLNINNQNLHLLVACHGACLKFPAAGEKIKLTDWDHSLAFFIKRFNSISSYFQKHIIYFD